MFGIKSKKEVAENYRHCITVKTDIGDIELVNLKNVSITKIFDIFYIFCDDENAIMRPIYGIRTGKAKKEAEKKMNMLWKAYKKGDAVITLS